MQALVDRAERVTVFVFLTIAVGVFWPPLTYFAGSAPQPIGPDPFSTAFNTALIGFLVVAGAARARAMTTALRCAWPLLPLLVMGYVSVFWSVAPEAVILPASKITATALFGVYLIARSEMGDLIALFVKANLVAIIASFVVVAVAPQLAFSTNLEYAHAWRGAFTDKNELGMIAALGILSSIYAFRHRYGSRLLSGFAIPANLAALLFSESMTSILVVLPIGLYVALLGTALRRRSGAGLLAGFAILLLGLLAAATVYAMSGDVLAALGRNATLSNRTRIWGMVLTYIAARPWFGYGLASFWRPDGVEANQIWAALQWQTPHSHNLWLELSLGLGLVGAGIAVWLWADAFWRAGRLLIAGARDGAFALVLLVAIFVDNLTEFAFYRGDDIQWLLFAATFTYLGHELAIRRRARSLETAASRSMPMAPLWPAVR